MNFVPISMDLTTAAAQKKVLQQPWMQHLKPQATPSPVPPGRPQGPSPDTVTATFRDGTTIATASLFGGVLTPSLKPAAPKPAAPLKAKATAAAAALAKEEERDNDIGAGDVQDTFADYEPRRTKIGQPCRRLRLPPRRFFLRSPVNAPPQHPLAVSHRQASRTPILWSRRRA